MNALRDESTYCHCYPVFGCEPAVAEVEGPENIWRPVCQRCMDISWHAGLRARKLQPTPPESAPPQFPSWWPVQGGNTAPQCPQCGQILVEGAHHICPGPTITVNG